MISRRLVLGSMASATAMAGLAACSGSSNSAGGSSVPEGETIELTYMHRLPDGEGMVPVNEIVQRWNDENPQIQVKAIKFDGAAAEMTVRLESEVNAGTAPDLAQVGYAEVPSLFTKGLLEDVSEEARKYESNYAAGAFALMGVGDAMVGLPQDTGPLVYYYNATEFERLGIDVPLTGDDLISVAQAAAANDKFAVSFQTDEAQYGLSAQSASAGAVWYRPENDAWTVDILSNSTLAVASMWQEILDTKAALLAPRWSEEFTRALVDGTLIGTIGAAWEAPLLAGDMAGTEAVGHWKVAQMPAIGSEMMSGPNGGSGVAVLKGAKNPAAAMEFNNWFNTQVQDLATQGLVVAATGSVETPEAVAEFYSGQDVMAELAEANKRMNAEFIYMPTWPALGDPMTRAADAAATGAGQVMAIFEAAQETSVSSLKDEGLSVNE